MPSDYGKGDVLVQANAAEALFGELATRNGWIAVKASHQEDMREHWDWMIGQRPFAHRVEVKGLKRLSRAGDYQDKWFWVEFKNTIGRPGWLYGKADLVAAQTTTGFLIVPREPLARLADRLVDRTQRVQRASAAMYKLYDRSFFGKKDEMAMIETSHLRSILWAEWLTEPPVMELF